MTQVLPQPSRSKRQSDRSNYGHQKSPNVITELVLANHVECETIKVNSTTGFAQVPSLTTAQRDALTAANGMLVYNTSDNKFQGYENGAWANLI